IVPAAQLVPKFQRIGRCNNYAVVQISKVPDAEETIKFKLDTQEIIYTIDMFRDTINLPVETPKHPFVAPINIEIIESFMNKVAVSPKTEPDLCSLLRVIAKLSINTV
ncbi:hypothetical protein Tco_1538571, partial [Tanacetum coccineum]